MIFVLIKIICVILGLCLSTDFMYKGLYEQQRQLFFEGFIILLVTILMALVIF